jgi:hypothetical protein
MKAKGYFQLHWGTLRLFDNQQNMLTKLVEIFHDMMEETKDLTKLRGNTPNAIQAAVKETKQKWVAFLSRMDEQVQKENGELILTYDSLLTQLEFNYLLRTLNTSFYESLCSHDKSFLTSEDKFNLEICLKMNGLLAESARELGLPVVVDKKTGNLKTL